MGTPIEMVWREVQDLRNSVATAQQVQVTSTSPLLVAGSDDDVPVTALGSYTPARGDTAWMLNTGVGPVLVGATRPQLPPSPNGTIATTPASGATTVAVTVDGSVESLPWLASYTPAAGHTVRINWAPIAGGGWSGCVLGRMGSIPVPKPSPPKEIVEVSRPVTRPPVTGTTVVRAINVGTWRSGGWRSDTSKLVVSTWTSQPPSTAVWYYGPLPSVLSGVTVTSARLWIPNLNGGPFAASPIPLYLHAAQQKAGSLPGRASSPFASPAFAENEARWLSGAAYTQAAQDLVDGAWRGLMAVSSTRSHYTTMAGLSGAGRDPMTGAWEITWERPA